MTKEKIEMKLEGIEIHPHFREQFNEFIETPTITTETMIDDYLALNTARFERDRSEVSNIMVKEAIGKLDKLEDVANRLTNPEYYRIMENLNKQTAVKTEYSNMFEMSEEKLKEQDSVSQEYNSLFK